MRSSLTILLVMALLGCNGNAGTQAAVPYPPGPTLAQAPFQVDVYNGTQWPLLVNVTSFYPTPVLIYPGTIAAIQFPSVPPSVSVDVQTSATPPFIYPTRSFTAGKDYARNADSIFVNYP